MQYMQGCRQMTRRMIYITKMHNVNIMETYEEKILSANEELTRGLINYILLFGKIIRVEVS